MKLTTISLITTFSLAGVIGCERRPSVGDSRVTAAPGSTPNEVGRSLALPYETPIAARDSVQVAIPSDSISIGPYLEFVRRLSSITAAIGGPDDFEPDDWAHEPDTFSVTVGNEQYVIAPSGAGERRIGSSRHQLALPVEPGLFIERLAFTRIDGDPFFLVQETDQEGAGGFVVRLDSMTLKQKWKTYVPGFNIGIALRDGQYLYLTCIGFVGKLNTSNGQYAWRHDDLYATEKFNSFEAPRLRGDTVEFPSDGRTIRVDRETGRRHTP